MKLNLNNDDNDNAISHYYQNIHRISKTVILFYYSLNNSVTH